MPRVSRIVVHDSTNRVDIGELEEGGVVYARLARGGASSNRTVRVEVDGVATSVNVRLDNVTAETVGNDYHDMTEPWSLCGEWLQEETGDVRFWGCPGFKTEGAATITATPYDGHRKGTGLTLSFTIVRGFPPAPDSQPVERDPQGRYSGESDSGNGGGNGLGGSPSGSLGCVETSGTGSESGMVTLRAVECPDNDPIDTTYAEIKQSVCDKHGPGQHTATTYSLEETIITENADGTFSGLAVGNLIAVTCP